MNPADLLPWIGAAASVILVAGVVGVAAANYRANSNRARIDQLEAGFVTMKDLYDTQLAASGELREQLHEKDRELSRMQGALDVLQSDLVAGLVNSVRDAIVQVVAGLSPADRVTSADLPHPAHTP